MNIYKVSRTDNGDYDTYSDFVVCAPDQNIASNIHPSSTGINIVYVNWDTDKNSFDSRVWVELGKSISDDIKMICKSFHAG